MQVGDQAFFYHSSNGKDTGIFGIARINREAYPDPTSFDKNSKYYDNKTSPANPKWFMVDLELVEEWGGAPLRLEEMKALKDDPDRKEAQAALSGMPLLQKGNRLSVQPVTAGQWDFICSLNAQKRKV